MCANRYSGAMSARLAEYRTLVLDTSFRPLWAIAWRRAMVLDLCRRVEVLEYYDTLVRTARAAFPLPAVVRLPHFLHRRPVRVALTRGNVLLRDGHRCQYCGREQSTRELTLDHVLPRSRGGRTTWTNVVAACGPCNRRKGSRTPAEAAMKLRRAPARPRSLSHGGDGMVTGETPREWRDYLPLEA